MRSAIAIVLTLMLTMIVAPNVSADETITIQVNHGLLLKVRNAERVVVAAPDIADVNLVTRSELMIIAKKIGETTISVWDARGFTTYRVLVMSGPVPDVAKAVMEALREPNVQVRIVGETVVLEGKVKSEADKARAEGIASAFGKRVVNLLTVEQPAPPPASATQVLEAQLREAFKDFPVVVKVIDKDTVLIEGTVANQLEFRHLEAVAKAFVKNVVLLVRMREPMQIQVTTFFAEIDRQALRQIGVEWGGAVTGGAPGTISIDPFTFHFGNLGQAWPTTALQLLIARLTLLESRGLSRTLANPRLVVLEGRPAKLLVGGEVPIPILGPQGQVTILFKEFGVRMELKTIVEAGEAMTLDLKTEVSSLDFANAIIAAGFRIPTIKSRRVETVLSMRPGEFLVMGGLIQRVESQTVQQIPLLGDIPILGVLFRSTRFQRGETELVIFVSPAIVRPTREAPPLPQPEPSPSP